MWDDPITETGPIAPPSRIDLPCDPLRTARGITWGVFFGAELWLAVLAVVMLLVACAL